ncbi:hypothetical protein DS742_25740 [Lacrimispora amygdalina]|uniref:Uncharacterized protein n=2 Tax=Lacrimispora amygdalina TaxID=253257 RepID=A0A3E2N4V1_9FIRM|nr:hypothetical protein DS742_25740 [Clostridium indicum]
MKLDQALDEIYKNLSEELDNINGIEFQKKQLLSNEMTPVEKLLNYYCIFDVINSSLPREKSDGDALFFEIEKKTLENKNIMYAKCADVTFSFWILFSTMIRIKDVKLDGVRKNKEGRYSKNFKVISNLLNIKDKEIIKRTMEMFDYQAKEYWTRGNLFLLPDKTNSYGKRLMNNDRFRLTEDKLDLTLWQCFKGGKLSIYFQDNNEKLVEWIKSEHLECMFSRDFFCIEFDGITKELNYDDADIFKTNIQCMYSQESRYIEREYLFSELSENEMKNYIINLQKVIKYRNNRFIKDCENS